MTALAQVMMVATFAISAPYGRGAGSMASVCTTCGTRSACGCARPASQRRRERTRITSERHANNVSLASLIARKRVPAEVPALRKTA
jgi:hypothetical protein